MIQRRETPPHVLLVEDNPGDVELLEEAFSESGSRVTIGTAHDGLAAMAYLRREGPWRDAPRPDLILLDLNLPRKDGRETLAEIKQDESLRRIPVLVLTSSCAPRDIEESYRLDANCFLTKPVDFEQFLQVVQLIERFWLRAARLPMA